MFILSVPLFCRADVHLIQHTYTGHLLDLRSQCSFEPALHFAMLLILPLWYICQIIQSTQECSGESRYRYRYRYREIAKSVLRPSGYKSPQNILLTGKPWNSYLCIFTKFMHNSLKKSLSLPEVLRSKIILRELSS